MSRVASKDRDNGTPVASGTFPALPGGHECRVSPFLFHSERPLPAGHPILKAAASLRDCVTRELKLPPQRGIILVYIFGEKGSFDHYIRKRYPHLPSRRAFFMAQGRPGSRDEDLVVLTWWSDQLEQDLRHELTHALVHGAIPDVPLWLDEGLAEYFELEAFPHTAEERRSQAISDFSKANRPDMFRLEGLRDIQQMGREEYREAWCWTRWMLQESPETRKILLTYLSDLRSSSKYSLAEKIRQAVPDLTERMVLRTRLFIPMNQP